VKGLLDFGVCALPRRLVAFLALGIGACGSAAAPGSVPARPASPSRVAADVPRFASNKRPVGDHVEGDHIEVLPAVGYDPNVGRLLGALGYYAMDGSKNDPLFSVTPYRHRFFAQAVRSTLGYRQYMLSYDGLYLGDSPYRLRAGLLYERNINANYFGVGERSMGQLEFQGRVHRSFDEQTAAASAFHDGFASPLYNHYAYTRPSGTATLERGVLGGLVRLELGAIVQHLSISRYDGTSTTGRDAAGNDVPAIHGPTKLGLDCMAGTVRGCSGGWNDLLKAGVAFDTRDFEPAPRRGVFADAVAEWSSNRFGSSYDYVRFSTTARVYWSPVPEVTDLVLASRFTYSMQTANAPFFAQGTLGGTERDIEGALGGDATLRGYRNNRFSGAVIALANAELRWTFWKFHLRKQHLELMLAPLLDVGRVFDKVELSLSSWRAAYGGGFRVAWNRSTIIRFDFATSREDTGAYLGVDLPF
jgi:outer membrane protein assembly factor BamA